MPHDTAHVLLTNDRQLEGFIQLCVSLKPQVIRLCVSLVTNLGSRVKDEPRDFSIFGDCGTSSNKSRSCRIAAEKKQMPLSDDQTMKPEPMKLKAGSIKVGDIFDDKFALKRLLSKISVIEKFDFDIVASKKRLLLAQCFVRNCSWRIRATTMSASSGSLEFIVRIYTEFHTCSAVDKYSRNRQVNAKCIGKMYVDFFSGGCRHLKGIMNAIKSGTGLEINYTKAHSALAYARDLVRGTLESGYQDLPCYLYKIKQASLGMITKLECDDKKRFKYLFIAFGSCIKGFELLRRVVVVDGAQV